MNTFEKGFIKAYKLTNHQFYYCSYQMFSVLNTRLLILFFLFIAFYLLSIISLFINFSTGSSRVSNNIDCVISRTIICFVSIRKPILMYVLMALEIEKICLKKYMVLSSEFNFQYIASNFLVEVVQQCDKKKQKYNWKQ